MVYIYAVHITYLPDPQEFPEFMEKLPKVRKLKIKKCKQLQARKQSAGAGLLLGYILKEYGLSDAKIKFGSNGKPEIEGIFFNLSHSKNMVICAVSDKAVGCDIEQVSVAPEKVAERFFSEAEQRYLSQYSGEEKNKEFYRLWTMKESYMKMTGEGMRLLLHQFELHFGECVQLYRDGSLQDCFIKEYELLQDETLLYQVSVCAEEDTFAEQVTFKTWEELVGDLHSDI